MWATVYTLPQLQSGSGNFVVTSDLSTEGNFFSMAHNNIAKNKGWGVYSFVNYHYVPYEDLVPTGVESVSGSDNGQTVIDMDAPLYNLRGQRVSHPVKGTIYIQNGKKVRY